MTDEIKLPPLPHPSIDEYPGPVLVVAFDDDHMHDYATQAVTEDRAQRDADHLAELRAYELTVANLREKAEQLDADLNEWAELFRKAALERNALREQLMGREHQDSWNRKCRLIVDTLLHESGYHEDSSARHNLAMMNFDSSPAVVEKLAQQAPQVPMTDDEIIKYFDKVSTKLGFGLDDILAFTYGALCAQSHHGIKEKP